MKLLKLLCVLTTLLSVNHLFAESEPKIKLSWGPEYELPSKHADAGFLGNMQDGFVQLGHQYGKSLSLQKFSTDLKLTATKLVDLKTMPKGYMSEQFLEWNGKTLWLFSTWMKKEEKERLFVQEIDIKKGDLAGGAKQLLECGKVTGSLIATGFYQFNTANKYKISFSSDSTKMFVYVKYPNELKDDSKNYERYGMWVFGPDFSLLWSQDVKMPYTEKKMDPINIVGDREGNFLMLAKVFNDDTRKEIKDDMPNSHFEILKYSKGEKAPSIIPFKFEDKFVAQLKLSEDKQGRIVCSGYYISKDAKGKLKNIGGADGTFILRLDAKENKLVNVYKGFYEIPTDVIKSFESEKTQKKMDKAEEKGKNVVASNLKLREIEFNEDGSMLIIGEWYFVSVMVYYGRSPYTQATFHYNDVLAQYINAQGELVWTKKIPKQQSGSQRYPGITYNPVYSNTFGLGYKLMPYNGNNYLFFIDNIKNLNLATNQAPSTHIAGAGGFLMAVKLDDAGSAQKTKLFDLREVKEQINIIEADKVGPSTLIRRAWNKKKSKICLISIT